MSRRNRARTGVGDLVEPAPGATGVQRDGRILPLGREKSRVHEASERLVQRAVGDEGTSAIRLRDLPRELEPVDASVPGRGPLGRSGKDRDLQGNECTKTASHQTHSCTRDGKEDIFLFMPETTVSEPRLSDDGSASVRSDATTVAWWFIVALAGGGAAGLLIGGIGGRLAMFLLRVSTGEPARGVISDDGFVIGQFTFGDSAGLLVATTGLGGVGGLLYLVVRTGLPERIRVPIWTLAGAAIGGEALVHSDGVDFQLLKPQALAIALFIAIPALGATVSGFLIERWLRVPPWSRSTWWSARLVAMALATSLAVPVAGLLGLVVLAARRSPARVVVVLRIARVLIPILLIVWIAAAALGLYEDVSAILSP
jgi:hypothetical protein